MTELFHLTETATWQAARAAGEYRQSTRGVTLAQQGFIHCSLRHQVRAVAELVYADADGLVLLTIDPGKLTVPVKFEPPEPGGMEFPHIYGPIPVDAVVNVVPVTRDATGRMVLPG